MYVCVCNAITDRDIRKAAAEGATSLRDLARDLKVATCCGRCAGCARQVLYEACAGSNPGPALGIPATPVLAPALPAG